jgi:hypothetical protein
LSTRAVCVFVEVYESTGLNEKYIALDLVLYGILIVRLILCPTPYCCEG